ncbi:hypothetical protein DFQ27_008852, partial [Actinomortierella ambigua]
PASFVRSTVTQYLCGHQVGRIRELRFKSETIERYIVVAPQLGQLRTLTTVARCYSWPDVDLMNRTYPSAVYLVQALQRCHGKS